MKIIGHSKQISYLNHLATKQKLPHALLFTGPEGIGKKQVAIHFTQTLFCVSKNQEGQACQACTHCLRILQNQHPDFILIAPEEQIIKTEVIRHLKQRLSLKALEAPYTIALIDEAELLHPSASNVLLKTLEEPPSNCLLILITASPYRLLKTILSRCQKLPFSPLNEEEMRQVISQHEGKNIDPRKLSLAQGSPGLWLKFSDEALDLVENNILPSLQAQPKDLMTLLQIAEKISKEDKSSRLSENVLNLLLAEWNRQMLAQPNKILMEKTEAIYEALKKIKNTYVNPQLTFENLFLKLCL